MVRGSTRTWARRILLLAVAIAVPVGALGGAALVRTMLTGGAPFSVCDGGTRVFASYRSGVQGDVTTLWQIPLHPVLRRLTPSRSTKQSPFFRCFYLVRSPGGPNTYMPPYSGKPAVLKPGVYGVEMDIYGYYVYGGKGRETATPSMDLVLPPRLLLPLP